jgi:uroporphyrinogen III methyltransferase/synthase
LKQLPLAGRRVVVTRARAQAAELTQALQALGATAVACPTLEIKAPTSWAALDQALARLEQYEWLAFTSANGVEFFLRRMTELQLSQTALAAKQICVIGAATAKRVRSAGLRVDLLPTVFTSEGFVAAFRQQYGRTQGKRMLLPAASATRDAIRPALALLGVQVDVVAAYQTALPAVTAAEALRLLSAPPADYIIFTSPTTVAHLAALLETQDLAAALAATRVACLGPATAAAARRAGLQVALQPAEQSVPALVAALAEAARE